MRGLTLAAIGLVILLNVGAIQAQTATPRPLVNEGIAGYIDKGRRGPVLSVGITRGDKVVSILADAHVVNEEYTDYPIQFDFFVNRKLFSSQIRSKALPGPVGVDVGTDVATPPFNYTVLAKLIHPNREFSTVIEGAVFATNLVTTFDCSLTIPGEDEDSTLFTESNITSGQSGNETIVVTLSSARGENGAKTLTSSSSLVVNSSDSSARGSLSYTLDGSQVTLPVSGSSVFTSGNLQEISVSSDDGETVLECS